MMFSDGLDLSWKVLVFITLASTAIFGTFSLLYPSIRKTSGRFSSGVAHSSVAIFLCAVFLVLVLLVTVDQEIQKKCFAYFADQTGTFATTRILGGVWLAGFMSLVLRDFLLWKRFRKRVSHLSMSHESDYQIVQNDLAATTIGFLKSTILIPDFIVKTPEVLQYVLAHERMHVQRKDGMWNLVTLIAVRLAWFHPCSYIFARQRILAVEMATDEAVLSRYDFSVKNYCEALLTAARSNTLPAPLFTSLGVSQEYKDLKVRIGNLCSESRPGKLQMVGALVVFSVIWSFGIGNAFAAIQVGPTQDEELMCYQVQHEKIIESLFKSSPETNKCE